ncbi:MAG: nickel-dependent lactate racemase [Candidatus Eisenbacteria bacterium]
MEDRKVHLLYGTQKVVVTLPQQVDFETVMPRVPPSPPDVSKDILSALREPDGASLEKACGGTRNVLIIVSDKTRVTGVRLYLPIVTRFLLECGVNADQIQILVANGMHDACTPRGLSEFLPGQVLKHFRVTEHDCRNRKAHFLAGKTSLGTDVRLNRKLAESDLILVTGSIGLHYFAGFRGGRKAILPGVASYETICANHRLTITEDEGFHPMCKNAILDGNPVHEQMVEVMEMIPKSFLFNTITDLSGNIVKVFAGDPLEAHSKGCEFSKGLAETRVSGKADCAIVSCGGYPRDSSFIQSHKGMESASHVLKDGGSMIVLAECRDGLGSDTFLDWFGEKDLSHGWKRLLSDYTLHGHTALSAALKLRRFKIYLVSALDREVASAAGFVPVARAEDALREIMKERTARLRALVFPEAAETLPVVV